MNKTLNSCPDLWVSSLPLSQDGCGGGRSDRQRCWKWFEGEVVEGASSGRDMVVSGIPYLALTLKYFVGSGMRDLFLRNSQVLLSSWFLVCKSKSRGYIAFQSHWMTSSWPFSPFSRIRRGFWAGSKLSSSYSRLSEHLFSILLVLSAISFIWEFPSYDEKQSTSHMGFTWEPCEVGRSSVLGLI